ncbi:hypothetical protein QZH41_003448 [Actinostola sp. cb2023]|nr:hypothetical protein QZH41_003448 [Actinostola sp. cb2023]
MNSTRSEITGTVTTYGSQGMIQCYTYDNTAVEATDYTPKGSVLTFEDDVLNQKFDVEIKNDYIVEENEILKVTCFTTNTQRVNVLSSCVNLNIEIINDDTYIYFCYHRQTSIKEDAGPYVVRLCRIGVLSATHRVELCRTTEGNTVPSIIAACDAITFSPNEEIKSHNIGIINDDKGEQEYKRFTIYIKSRDPTVTLINGATRSYYVILQDDDNTYFFQSVSLVTANEDSGAVNVTINRVGQLSVQSTVSESSSSFF